MEEGKKNDIRNQGNDFPTGVVVRDYHSLERKKKWRESYRILMTATYPRTLDKGKSARDGVVHLARRERGREGKKRKK